MTGKSNKLSFTAPMTWDMFVSNQLAKKIRQKCGFRHLFHCKSFELAIFWVEYFFDMKVIVNDSNYKNSSVGLYIFAALKNIRIF